MSEKAESIFITRDMPELDGSIPAVQLSTFAERIKELSLNLPAEERAALLLDLGYLIGTVVRLQDRTR